MFKLTEDAAAQLKSTAEKQQISDYIVRIGVAAGGCSGFQYKLNYDANTNIEADKDDILEQFGVTIVIDKKSALYLDETTLEWCNEINHLGFKFINPLAVRTCGCNASFGV